MDKGNIKEIDKEAHKPEVAAAPESTVKPELSGVETSSSSLRIHVTARGFALTTLTVLAIIFALQWAQKFFIPLVLGILITYTLNPLMNWLERLHIPRVIGATLLMGGLIFGSGWVGNTLRGEFVSIVDQLPAAAHKLSTFVSKVSHGRGSTIQQVQQAANEIEKATNQAAGVPSSSQKTAPAATSEFKLREWLLASSLGAVGFISEMAVVLMLVFFLLISGDTFKRKLVNLAGPSLSSKKITLQILGDINTSIQRYLFMLLVTNSLLALLMWGAFRMIGLQNAGAWAVTAGLLHIVPYFGPLLTTIATGLTAFLQFGSLSMVLLVCAVSLSIATLVGMLITTWMTGKIARMNPAAVFIGLLFWGWLWNAWGFLLGIPIIVIAKVISEHVEELRPVAELLGE
jgi:predicted PurR-regulated permease PerM